MAQVTLIKGRIETDDGQVREFHITSEGWAQWGNTTERLGDTVDALQCMGAALFEIDCFADEEVQQ